MKADLRRNDLLYPELSYKIAGCAFDVYRKLGSGHLEKIYQKALAIAFKNAGLKFTEQAQYDIFYAGEFAGKGYFDFLIEDKIIVELKRGKFNDDQEIHQVSGYLKMSGHQLGIIIRFTSSGAKCKRILNINPEKEAA